MKSAPRSPQAKAAAKRPSRWNTGVAVGVVGAVFAALTVLTWRRWPDLVVDFGAQLYIPWQISRGAVLYRDVAYLAGGPLSQHYHALLFKIFGVSFLTVVISNLAALVVLLTVMYRSFCRCSDQLAALTVCVAVLTVFAFAQYPHGAVFNYITPYCAEAVHGLVLSVLAVALLARWIETEQPRLAAAAGLCGGLTFLTKPDIFLALALTFLVSGVYYLRTKRNGHLPGRLFAMMAVAGVIPLAGFFLWFFRVEDFQQSLRSVFAAWIYLVTTRIVENPYYRSILGMDEPLVMLRQAAIHFVVLAAVAGVCAAVCLRNIPRLPRVILPMAVEAVLLAASWKFDWFWCGRCLPLVCLTLLVLLLRRGSAGRSEPGWVFALLWAFWSLVLLTKLGVFWRIFHYGFVLAMPAFVSGIYLLLWVLPRELERFGVRPLLFRAMLALMLLVGLARLTRLSLLYYSNKTMPVGSGADTILGYDSRSDTRDVEFSAALRWIQTNVPPSATMTVLPQGATLNYLSRHTNPCGYMSWDPFEMSAHGQAEMTASFIQHSPDYVVVMLIHYREYRETIFGANKGFGEDVMEWIAAHYEPVWRTSDDWLTNPFGILIFKRMIDMTPNNAIFHFNKGEFDLKANRTNEAISNLTAAAREKPDYVEAHNELGGIYLIAKRYDEATSQFQEAIRLKPDDAEAHYRLGLALGKTGQIDKAIGQYREAIRLKPDDAEARLNLGAALDGKGQIEEAISQYWEAIRLKPNYVGTHYYLGNALRLKGQIDKAIDQYRESIRLRPDYAEAHNNLGAALNAKGQIDEAIRELQEAVRLKPESAEMSNNLSSVMKMKATPPMR